MRKIKTGYSYRYIDKEKNVNTRLTITGASNGFVYAISANGKKIKAELKKVKDHLYDSDGYSLSGYDIFGYDQRGYDKTGYNRNGVNREGFDRNGSKVAKSGLYEPSCHAGAETTNQLTRNRKHNY